MSDAVPSGLCHKIARLVEELGWNQQTFARRANLNRLTVAHICSGKPRRLHNATVEACAQALGVGARELRIESFDRLLPKIRPPRTAAEQRRRLYDQAMPAPLKAWLDAHPVPAAELTADEIDELMSLSHAETSTAYEVAEFVARLERRRRLVHKVIAIAGTEYVDLLEGFVAVLFDKVQPYSDRQ